MHTSFLITVLASTVALAAMPLNPDQAFDTASDLLSMTSPDSNTDSTAMKRDLIGNFAGVVPDMSSLPVVKRACRSSKTVITNKLINADNNNVLPIASPGTGNSKSVNDDGADCTFEYDGALADISNNNVAAIASPDVGNDDRKTVGSQRMARSPRKHHHHHDNREGGRSTQNRKVVIIKNEGVDAHDNNILPIASNNVGNKKNIKYGRD